MTGAILVETGKPRKLNFKYTVRGPFDLTYPVGNTYP